MIRSFAKVIAEARQAKSAAKAKSDAKAAAPKKATKAVKARKVHKVGNVVIPVSKNNRPKALPKAKPYKPAGRPPKPRTIAEDVTVVSKILARRSDPEWERIVSLARENFL